LAGNWLLERNPVALGLAEIDVSLLSSLPHCVSVEFRGNTPIISAHDLLRKIIEI